LRQAEPAGANARQNGCRRQPDLYQLPQGDRSPPTRRHDRRRRRVIGRSRRASIDDKEPKMKKNLIANAVGAALALTAFNAMAAAPADWSAVPAVETGVFYPGVSPVEWITKGTEHGGARVLKKGETCAACHSEEIADMGEKMVSGKKIEPSPIAGKTAFIATKVQAAHDGENLYLRLSWKQPAASGNAPMDELNPIKIAYMLEAGDKVALA